MKKLIVIILISMLMTAAAAGSYAETQPGGGKTATGMLKNVIYSNKGGSETVTISLADYTDFSVMKLSDPDRIVIDISNAISTGKQQHVEAGGKYVKSIRYAQFDQYTARVVLNVEDDPEYGIGKTSDGLIVYIGDIPESTSSQSQGTQSQPNGTAGQNPGTASKGARHLSQNITYSNSGDRVYFLLQGVKLTDGDVILKRLYTGSYDSTGRRYTITFSDSQEALGSGTYKIDDSYISDVKITKNTDAGTASITFNAKGRYSYLVYTRGGTGITSVTVLKPAADNEKIVVIDAGHGGKMTGAIYRNMVEKDINLDIAQRLESLLKKKGIHTYMIRDDDTDVDNFERAYIANALMAKLFLSIHNNAMDDTSYGGTMTLYFPTGYSGGFSGKSFADIIQQKLLGRLKTTDRKTVERPNLVVLRATAMTSALSEVAFITNTRDRLNLGKASFRQNAAQALCDAVVKALPKV